MSNDNGAKSAAQPPTPRPLPRRFYKSVAVEASSPRGNAQFRVLLDGKPVRTPAKAQFAVPTEALARAIAEEWEAQRPHIDPATMPLTRIANSAIDGVVPRRADVEAEIVKYAASDLLCYRAGEPETLVRRQAELWDPLLAWSRESLGADLAIAQGLMPIVQPREAQAAVARALAPFDAFGLAALHIITTLTGSALIALAHAHGRLDAQATWTAAHVDEDFQITRWGEDAQATARRNVRSAEMLAASRLLALLGRS